MIDFEIWWNSADADAFRAEHEEFDGEHFRPVWDAAVRASLAAPQPAQADARSGLADEQIRAAIDTAIAENGTGELLFTLARVIERTLAAHPGQPEPRAEVTDTARLDWMIAQQAWIQWTVRDGSIRQCQVYDQDEDENYHILSGDDRYFNTPREAIDAARAGEKQ